MYKDNSCRSSPQPPPASEVAEEGANNINNSVEAHIRYRNLKEEENFSCPSESTEELNQHHLPRSSIGSYSSTSTNHSLHLQCNSEDHNHKICNIKRDIRILHKIGFIASRVRVLGPFYGDFNLINPYSPTKQKEQLKFILEKHSINDVEKQNSKSQEVTRSQSIASLINNHHQLPTDSSVDEDSSTRTTVRRKYSSTSTGTSITFLEDLLVNLYEDNCSKLTILKKKDTHEYKTKDNSMNLHSKFNKENHNFIVMSSKTVNKSVERLLESSSTDIDRNLGSRVSIPVTPFLNANKKQSSLQQNLLQPRGSLFLQPTIQDNDHTRRRRASDCSTHLGTLKNQLQINLQNNNCRNLPFIRGSSGGTTDSILPSNIGNPSTIILSKSCSNVDGGTYLTDTRNSILYSQKIVKKVGSISNNQEIEQVDSDKYDINSPATGINTPLTHDSNNLANGNNEYSVIQLNNTIIQCRFNDEDFRALVRELKKKVEYTERMNWLCLSKRPMGPPHRKSSLPKHKEVKQCFLDICDTKFSEEVKAALRLPAFDSYEWSDAHVIHLMQTMFFELGFMDKFNIPVETLREWLYEVYKHYNEVPFHNFRHCFCVAQMMYAITRQANLLHRLGDLECLILLVSCICHDLDHPGYNNIYQINARTELALRYNDISPLENHHCSVAFRLLEHPECNIFKNFTRETFNQIREGIIRCILATDMARHNEILTQFKEITPVFDYNDRSHVNLLCMILIKVADISNEARPMDVAEPWLDRLLQEFFAQSAAEKSEGLPVTPFMDPDKISKPGSQVRFIGLVLLPLFEALGELVPEVIELIIIPVRVALEYYKRLNDAQNKSRKSVIESSNLEHSSVAADCFAPAVISTCNNSNITNCKTASETVSPQMPRSQSGVSIKSRRSIPSQTSASRTSVDEPQALSAELHDLPEGSESGDSETATEVDVAEKTSKFKVDTEGSSNRSKSSHSTSRKSSREKRPSMIGEMCSGGSGQRMRSSYGNIHGYNFNRSHFGTNRAVSLDQASGNNRRLSDGLQQVISDSNVFYNRQNRSIEASSTACQMFEDLNRNATGVGILNQHIAVAQMEHPNLTNTQCQKHFNSINIPENINDISSSKHMRTTKKDQNFALNPSSSTVGSTNGNILANRSTIEPTISPTPKSKSTYPNMSLASKPSWKARFKQISDYFTSSFEKTSKRVSGNRADSSSLRNNNGTHSETLALDVEHSVINDGICCTISKSFQSPISLTKPTRNYEHVNFPVRHRAYSLDVPSPLNNVRYSGSSSGGCDSSKKSHLDGSINGEENNSNNTLHSSSGGSELATNVAPPICLGSVDVSDTIVFVTSVSKGVTEANLAETEHISLNVDLGSSSEQSKI